jgi:broad specificity phosphatase PhoE
VEALVMRALEGSRHGARVAVVSTSERGRGQAEALAGRLDDVTRRLVAADDLPPTAVSTQWTAASLGGGRGERVAQDSARTVLVVPRGAALRDVAGRLADLRDLGVGDIVLSVVRG